MLSLIYSEDKNINCTLIDAIFDGVELDGFSVLLLEDGLAIGIATVALQGLLPVIKRVGILSDYRGKGYGDFFMRSLFFMLSEQSGGVAVSWSHKYFDKFGFKQVEGLNFVSKEDLIFPSYCKH